MSSISFPASADSVSDSKEPGCEPLPSARLMNGAANTLPITGLASTASQMFALSPPTTSVQLTLFAEASHAKTLARQASASASTENEADCGGKCCGWCEKCDPVGLLLRTSLHCAIEAMTGLPPTWQRRATPAGRSWWQLSTSGLRRNAKGRGLWQTPTTRDFKGDLYR